MGAQPASLVMPATAAMRPACCAGNDVADVDLHRLAIHHNLHGLGPDLDLVAAEVGADALDHAGVVALPAVLEQPLLGELLLGVDNDDFRRRVGLLQHVGHHRDPLVGSWRAAERVGGRHHAVGAAFRHGLDLRLQKLGLRARLVGVRHAILLREVPSGDGALAEVDAWREHEAVVGEAAAAREPHAPLLAVDGNRPVVHDVDPVIRGQIAVAVPDGRVFAEAADVEVREEARVVGAARLHERHVHGALRILGDVARGRRAARAAAHDHDAGAPLGHHRRCRQRRYRRCRRSRGCKESAAG